MSVTGEPLKMKSRKEQRKIEAAKGQAALRRRIQKIPRFGCIIFWRLELQNRNEELWDIVQNFAT